jgi:DNA-binding beta-propeller fold protein YncE
VFRYPTVRYNITAINGMNFNRLMGFGFSSLFNASYYVADIVASKVHIFNDDWSYVSYKTFTRPTYMITIDRSIYMTGDINIWKLDKDLNILLQFNSTGSTPYYSGIYFNSSNGFIYVAPCSLAEIQVFDLNLTYSHNISLSPYIPYAISECNN